MDDKPHLLYHQATLDLLNEQPLVSEETVEILDQLQMQGRAIEVVNFAETDREDWVADLTSVIYSFCARLYGQRRAKLKAEALVKQVEEP